MPKPSSPSFRPFWPALVCAALSGALWIWSRQLPESTWEKSGPVAATPAVGLPPAESAAPAASPDPHPEVPSPTPTPTPTPSALASASPTPAPEEAAIDDTQAAPSATPSAPTPVPTPRPSEEELLGPLPQHSNDELAARASATPEAALSLADIARNPRLWPKQVVLLVPVHFAVMSNGVLSGNLQMPAGRAVTLKQVYPDGSVLLEIPGAQAKTKAQATDLLARARLLAKSQPAQ
ncbi:MAG: hypothetical protein ACFUZC_03060 [Chthoniobacteraceae bacterium]